jgi:hypothetical protein
MVMVDLLCSTIGKRAAAQKVPEAEKPPSPGAVKAVLPLTLYKLRQ